MPPPHIHPPGTCPDFGEPRTSAQPPYGQCRYCRKEINEDWEVCLACAMSHTVCEICGRPIETVPPLSQTPDQLRQSNPNYDDLSNGAL